MHRWGLPRALGTWQAWWLTARLGEAFPPCSLPAKLPADPEDLLLAYQNASPESEPFQSRQRREFRDCLEQSEVGRAQPPLPFLPVVGTILRMGKVQVSANGVSTNWPVRCCVEL